MGTKHKISMPYWCAANPVGDLDKISGASVDYNSVNEEALKLGSLDMLVNKKIMGM